MIRTHIVSITSQKGIEQSQKFSNIQIEDRRQGPTPNASGADPKKIYYAGFEHSDWLKNLE